MGGLASDLFADEECFEAVDVRCRSEDRSPDSIGVPPRSTSVRCREARSASAIFGKPLESSSKIDGSARIMTMGFQCFHVLSSG